MKWHYKCPLCKNWRHCDWELHGEEVTCKTCNKKRKIPTPSDQHDAYVDQHDWPEEMEKVVKKLKGTACVIKGCKDKDITLDHIVAWDNKGKTSVSNLQPMCQSHNSSKGTKDFNKWLREEGLETR